MIGGSRVLRCSCIMGPQSTPAEGLELFNFIGVALRTIGKRFTLGHSMLLRMTSPTREHRKTTVGTSCWGSCTQVGWLNRLRERISGE